MSSILQISNIPYTELPNFLSWLLFTDYSFVLFTLLGLKHRQLANPNATEAELAATAPADIGATDKPSDWMKPKAEHEYTVHKPGKTTLETSGKVVKLHSKRVEKL